jgi:hypothetical protein
MGRVHRIGVRVHTHDNICVRVHTHDNICVWTHTHDNTLHKQAMDRVHRIGQKRVVFCYRLVSQGTVEERIVAAAQHKTVMNAMVMQVYMCMCVCMCVCM